MKFNVPGKDFAAKLQAVGKVVNAKNTLSIYDNFLLSLKGDRLFITGSDQENFLTASLEVFDADEDFSIAVNVKSVLEMTKEITSQPLTFEVNPQTLAVKLSFPSGQFDFPAIDGAEYPKRREDDLEKTSFSLSADTVKRGIENTIFAVSTDVIRPIMTGILWDLKPDASVFVSSDTHKLVRYINKNNPSGKEVSFILPQKPAGIIRGLISDQMESVEVVVDEKSAVFTLGDYVLACRLIKGQYPNYNRVIPENNPFRLTVDRDSLLAATRRMSIFASQASGLVRFKISDSVIGLSAQDQDYFTSAEESVPCNYQGSPMTIGFKADYMREVLSNLKGETVMIELSDPARPGLFMPEEADPGEEVVMLQMPMQVLD